MKKITLLIAFLFAVCLSHNYAQNTWKRKADFGGTARQGAVGFSIGSKGYMGTGYDGGSYKNDFWEYDPATNAWTQKANFGGTARYAAVGFSIGNKGYIGTGYNNDTSYNDFWEYDPATNSWTQKANFGGIARLSAVGFSIGSKGYIGTGFNGYRKDFWEYDPSTDTWTRKADFGGTARGGATGFSIGNKGYIGMGSTGFTYKNDLWEYDPATNAWTKKANIGGIGLAKAFAAGFSIGSKGYIGTGYDGYRNDLWEYDPATNAWTQKANFGGGARRYATGFSIGNKGYIGTGDAGIPEKDFWEYTPENTCLPPSDLNVQQVTDTSALLKWHFSGVNILHRWLRYRAVGDAVWVIRKGNAAKTRLLINGLMPNTNYEWQMKSLCAEDTSGWVKGPDFTTTASFSFSSTTSAITNNKLPGDIRLQIMPNPNKGNFTIQLQLPAEAAITTLALYDNMGEKVWQQDAGIISGAVYKNISLQNQLPPGIYMMVIQRNDVRLEQKLSVIK